MEWWIFWGVICNDLSVALSFQLSFVLFLEFLLLSASLSCPSASELSMIENQGRKICFYVVRLELPPSLAGMLSSGATAVGCHNALELKHFAFLFEDCWFFLKDVKQKGKKGWKKQNKTGQCSYSRIAFGERALRLKLLRHSPILFWLGSLLTIAQSTCVDTIVLPIHHSVTHCDKHLSASE